MSGWGWGSFFGGNSAKSKDAPKNAILGLRSTLEMLAKREKHLQNQMDEQDAIARKNVNTNKAAAKVALRRKKNYEHLLEQTTSQMMTVESEISSIETANINKETLDAMKRAQQAMRAIHGNLTVDKVDQTMEEFRAQHDIAKEIAEALAQPQTTMDEGELDDELNELQNEELEKQIVQGGKVPLTEPLSHTPGVPSRQPVQQEDDEDTELRKLQEGMAM
ncbi:hypothetical protein K470DRAFT_281627 [Piedraia hortae CBS 480.64]|uniref:Vacuolar-sorting protein SNF7 n=1 Tax=Piedraia hortae CBS 480.64 TaxID=1314780 RepID=A0A6A7C346_9PEZI|nr:hypothetical protein K470DRAFT_281627 [Piedraia hortae CBS 480.64]